MNARVSSSPSDHVCPAEASGSRSSLRGREGALARGGLLLGRGHGLGLEGRELSALQGPGDQLSRMRESVSSWRAGGDVITELPTRKAEHMALVGGHCMGHGTVGGLLLRL